MANKRKKIGIAEKISEYFTSIADAENDDLKKIDITEGCRVMLNIPKIKSKKSYAQMNPKYKEFIDLAGNMVFTAHIENSKIVSLKEDSRWLFWKSDLIKINDDSTEL
ncbi:MAG: hypothetical protein IJO14_03315 [Clostridia bacterium]|nr:hypothetical protein [Clostridia bacterium]